MFGIFDAQRSQKLVSIAVVTVPAIGGRIWICKIPCRSCSPGPSVRGAGLAKGGLESDNVDWFTGYRASMERHTVEAANVIGNRVGPVNKVPPGCRHLIFGSYNPIDDEQGRKEEGQNVSRSGWSGRCSCKCDGEEYGKQVERYDHQECKSSHIGIPLIKRNEERRQEVDDGCHCSQRNRNDDKCRHESDPRVRLRRTFSGLVSSFGIA